MRFWLIFLTVAMTAHWSEAVIAGQLMPMTPMELGADMAVELKKALAPHMVARARIAVMPFANINDSITAETVNSAFILRGELVQTLRQLAPEVEFPTLTQLQADIRNLKKDSLVAVQEGVLRQGKPEQAAELLKELRWDVVLLPYFEAHSGNQLAADKAQVVKTGVIARVSDGTENFIAIGARPQILERLHSSQPSGRFVVEILVDGKPIQNAEVRETTPHTPHFLLPPEMNGRQFSLRLTNKGAPSVGYVNENTDIENDRIVAAAVFVNGINTIGQPLKTPETDDSVVRSFVSRHPLNASRHLMCSPGRTIQFDDQNGILVKSVDTGGQSEIVITGFETSGNVEPFGFRPTASLPASAAGVAADAGVISVWFFAQNISGDRRQWGPDEVVVPYHIRFAPDQTWHSTVSVHPRPVEVQHLVYSVQVEAKN